jgi:hypothetical protein
MKTVIEALFLIAFLYVILLAQGCHSGMNTGNTGDLLDKIPESGKEAMWRVVVKTDWVTTACLIGVVIGIFAFLNGQKVGLAIVGACSAGLFMGIAMHRFAVWFAVCGLIGSIASGLASVLANKKAVTQLVQGVENVKGLFDIGDDVTNDDINTLMAKAQDKDTAKKVLRTKADLKIKEIIV